MKRAITTAVLAVGCGGARTQPATVRCPEPAPAATATKPPAWSGLISARPAKTAPPELAQFGRLVGTWRCVVEWRQPDGTFARRDQPSTWTWFYSLGGRAIQDVFEPASGVVGTNLRIYNPETRAWEIRWVTGALTDFRTLTAKAVGDTMVLRGEAPATAKFGAHARKLTFFDITDDSFEWTYEATRSGTETGWQVYQRLHCTKTAGVPPLI